MEQDERPGVWRVVARSDEVTAERPLSVVVDDKEIGIYRVNGRLHAIEDVCPHEYALLTEGFVDGENVECCLHGATFNVCTGKCLKEPGGRDLATYHVREIDGSIELSVD